MVTSIMLNGMYNVRVNEAGKIKIGDKIFNVHKDIPFVRYRFKNYNSDALGYIKEMKNKFPESTHLVQVDIESLTYTPELLSELNNMGVARYVYIDVTDEIVANKSFSTEALEKLSSLRGSGIDRLMMRDNSNTLDALCSKTLKTQVAKCVGLKDTMVGVCSSPLSFEDNACLTALKARELMSLYSCVSDMSLPTANHQCLTSCGCVRYIEINEDTVLVSDKTNTGSTTKREKKASSTNIKTDKQVKTVKKKVSKNMDPQAYLF